VKLIVGNTVAVLTVGGETSHALVGMKNRSWGVRNWNHLPMYHWLTAQFGDFSVNTWLFEDQQGEPLFADGAVTTEGGSITRIVSVEQALDLHEGSTKRVKARHLTLTTEEGETLELEGREIGSIPLAVLPDRFSDANPEEFATAEKAALWFEQHPGSYPSPEPGGPANLARCSTTAFDPCCSGTRRFGASTGARPIP